MPINSDEEGDKLEVRLVLAGRTMKVLIRIILVLIGGAIAALSAPEVARLLSQIVRLLVEQLARQP